MGGMSAEREVSLETGRAIAGALSELGHEAIEIDVGRDLPEIIATQRPDVAFMALHGRGGEDGTVQGLLEVMRIPYTGCSVLASALTMDKVVTKEVLAYHGVPLVEDVVLGPPDRDGAARRVAGELGYPVMVKPASEGSSIGVAKAEDADEFEAALDEALARDCRVLVERFVDGRQLTVGIIGSEPMVLPVLEIKPKRAFYDYEAKYQPGMTEYEVPAALDEADTERARRLALESFDVLLCEGISRVDLMLEESTGGMYVLEVNTIPGMTATSLVPKAAAAIGMDFGQVVSTVLGCARLKVELEE